MRCASKRRLVECTPDVTLQLVEEGVDRRVGGVWLLAAASCTVVSQSDEVLLHAAVQFTLDRAAVGIHAVGRVASLLPMF